MFEVNFNDEVKVKLTEHCGNSAVLGSELAHIDYFHIWYINPLLCFET